MNAAVSSGRMAAYLGVFAMHRQSGDPVTSEVVGRAVGVNPTQVRRDLSSLGRRGKRGVGYDCDRMIRAIRDELDGSGVYGAGPVLIAGGTLVELEDVEALLLLNLGADEATQLLERTIQEGEFLARKIEYLIERATCQEGAR